jgi:hypothetical protein
MFKYTKTSHKLTFSMEMLAYRSPEFRASAAKCLRLAAYTTDSSTRAALLQMAQRYIELAGDKPSEAQRGDALLPEDKS